MKAKYVSVWDGGVEIRTDCEYDPEIRNVTDIELSDVNGLEVLEREYIVLPDGTEIEREDFTIDFDCDEEELNFTDEEILRLKELVRKQN
jgi:hypothetical protein